MAHFGTTNTNHTTNMTYITPPRTSLLGMFGAVMGLDFMETIKNYADKVDFGWEWLSDNTTNVITKQRMKIEKASDFDNIIKKNDRGDLLEKFCKGSYYSTTLDSIEYIVPKDMTALESNWYIQVDDSLLDKVLEKLNNQTYQIQLGTSECIASIQDIEILDVDKIYDDVESNMIVCDYIIDDAICEKLPRQSKGHRQGYNFENYWSNGLNKVKGRSKFGVWKLDNKNIAIM